MQSNDQSEFEDENLELKNNKNENHFIDLKMTQRNGKKCITIIENLSIKSDLDIKKHVQIWKKKFACNVFIEKDENEKEIVKMTGNQISNVQEYLIKEKICKSNEIRIH